MKGVPIRKDLIDIQRRDTKIAQYWARIRVKCVRGGVKVALAHQPFNFEAWDICESLLVRKDEDFYLYVTVKKDVELRKEYASIIAIDIGARWAAVSVARHRSKPKFYGRRVREVRGKYFWLRRKLGRAKKLRAIKKIGHKERRLVNDELHKIAKEIVEEAERHDAIIAIGDLKGIRNNNKKRRGRKANRKINSMPSHKLKEYIRYKAIERGIAVIEVPEYNTSKQCSRCGSMNTERHSQGLFICSDCGYQVNADVNGAKNILKRAVGYMLTAGAAVTQPEGERFIAHSPTSSIRRMPLEGGGHVKKGFLRKGWFKEGVGRGGRNARSMWKCPCDCHRDAHRNILRYLRIQEAENRQIWVIRGGCGRNYGIFDRGMRGNHRTSRIFPLRKPRHKI